MQSLNSASSRLESTEAQLEETRTELKLTERRLDRAQSMAAASNLTPTVTTPKATTSAVAAPPVGDSENDKVGLADLIYMLLDIHPFSCYNIWLITVESMR